MSRAAQVELLILDVDGVLTDGSIIMDEGGRELKRFNVRDGFAVKLWQRMGFRVAVISGRRCGAVEQRLRQLGVELVTQGSADKAAALVELCGRAGTSCERMAVLADDWPDLPLMRRVAYPMAVVDAEPAVLAAAAYVTRRPGGRGAVRDAVEHLLASRGMLDRALHFYDAGADS